MSITTFISRRYFTGRKKMFAGFLSIVAVLGVALGVFALTVVMSVMQGFSRNLQDKLVGFNAHVVVSSPRYEREMFDKIREMTKGELLSSAVMVEGEGIADVDGRRDSSAQGIKIKGIDRSELDNLQNVNWFDFSRDQPEAHGAILGSELLSNLEIEPYNYASVTLIVPFGHVGPTGDIVPSKIDVVPEGTFTSGYFEHDSKMVVLSPKDAKRLLGDNATYSLHLWLKDIRDSERVAALIAKAYPDREISTWRNSNKKLFAALKLERIAMSMLLVLIIVIAAVSIISVIFMYVYARRRDIAVLMCLGMRRSGIRWIFVKIGAYIGIVGTTLGLAAGVAFCLHLKHHPFILPESYYLNHLPVMISVSFLITVGIGGVLISMLGALYPSDQAARLEPMELMRYE